MIGIRGRGQHGMVAGGMEAKHHLGWHGHFPTALTSTPARRIIGGFWNGLSNRNRRKCAGNPTAINPRITPSIVPELASVLTNHVKFGERFANGTINGEQQAMSAVVLICRFRQSAKDVIFVVEPGGRHNIIAHVVGNMPEGFVFFHGFQMITRFFKTINGDYSCFGFKTT